MHQADFAFKYNLLKELTEASGGPSYEDNIRGIVRRELEAHVDELRVDAMGNVIGTLSGETDYEVAVAAHMDEIGFMVRHVNDQGFLELAALGGWDARVMRAQRVTVHTEDEDIPGIIGSPPPHLKDEGQEEMPDVDDLRVDLGLDRDEVGDRVNVGDFVTMKQNTEIVGEHITGKALDDRVGIFAILEAAEKIDTPQVMVHFVATVQEEVGLRGAQALGIELNPDVTIVLDTTVANDIPGSSGGEQITQLNGGAAIKLQDAGVLPNPKVHRRLRRLANEREIPYQLEVFPSGATDTARFQRAGGGTPVGAISVPTRYLHTATESTHHADIQAAISLLISFLETETNKQNYDFDSSR